MAKAAPKQEIAKTQETKSAEVTAPPANRGAALPKELDNIYDQIMDDAGKGTSQKTADNVVPMVNILQALSPQCVKESPEFRDDAEPGMIWMPHCATPLVPGDGGIIVQPCWHHRAFVEWIPRARGGGMAGQHLDLPQDAIELEDPQSGKKKWIRKGNTNDLVDTIYHGVLINGAPFIIPMKSTNLSVSRGWMTLMNQFKLPNGEIAQSWLRRYHLSTTPRSNASGDWYIWKVEDCGPITAVSDYHEGRKLHLELGSGDKVIDAAAAGGDDEPARGGGSISQRADPRGRGKGKDESF